MQGNVILNLPLQLPELHVAHEKITGAMEKGLHTILRNVDERKIIQTSVGSVHKCL